MAREPGLSPQFRQRGSPANVRLSSIDQLAPLLERPAREQTGLFWAEGCRSLFSAIESEWSIHAVAYCPRLLRSSAVWQEIERLRRFGIPTLKVSREDFQLLSRRSEPDGIGVACEQRWQRLIDQEPTVGNVWVGLDGIRTPGNLGTILRTGAAVGARGVMMIGGEVDPFDPAAIRASMGAVFKVPLIRTSARALKGWKERRGVSFVGTSPGATTDYRRQRYRTPLVLMMGSERSGLRARQLALCDQVVKLPMTASVDSLNLAIAASVMLYEIMGSKK